MTANLDVPQSGGSEGYNGAELLNRGCFCITLDRQLLANALDQEAGAGGFADQLMVSHPTLFSNVSVFVPAATFTEMTQVVDAVQAAARLPGYRTAALSWAPPIALRDFGPVGALMGYDFHITPDGPRLIEVNTNAGGAFLNAILARAQRACCVEAPALFEPHAPATFGADIVDMFSEEWRRQRGSGKPNLIAIVDDAPAQQHLYPEFRLAKRLLEAHGIETLIADPGAFDLESDKLTLGGRQIDLVYNRMVDFGFDEARHATLRAAYVADAAVVTPNPHVHALLADKRNLALLSDSKRLQHWELAASHIAVLEAGVPMTIRVAASNADELWRDRRQLFFKPAAGYGSKATYRGDKLTRRVWAEILAADYVAQFFARPSERGIAHDGQRSQLKVDVRLYTYAGSTLLAAARLYRGQTTNMRTPGGGFAPVLRVRAA